MTMNRTARVDYASAYMVDAMETVGARLFFIDQAGWRMSSCLDEHHGTGIDVPVLRFGVFEVGVCPEVIVLATQGLEDDVFLDFLASLRAHTHLHIVNHDLPPDLAELAVLSAQRELNAYSFSIFESVRQDA